MEKIKVLIVEDDSSIVDLYNACLPDAVFEKIYIAGGEAAIKVFRTVHPELVILDVVLPTLSGPDVLRAIRETDGDRATPVIMSTSSSRDRDIQTCVKLGIQGYIIKPFNHRELCERILELFSRSRPRRAAEAKTLLSQKREQGLKDGPQFW